ncbi:metallophosphoesterase [Clostridiaceae bacterium M8S5]|nr:metallophosphoesterase [Clostridiaceae bacterium M8S5]
MSIYAIGDTHFDFTNKKPMSIFGENWKDHDKKIISYWQEIVTEEDLVLIPGDISWALKLKEAYNDLEVIDKLPGKKAVIKGNHDYWWETRNKLKGLNLKSVSFIHNNSYIYKDVAIVGTRGWLSKDSDEFKQKDIKIYNRELHRLRMSLESIGDNEVKAKIAMIHYPPFNTDGSVNEFVEIMKEYNVDICLYGHLHSEGHKYVIEGLIEGIEFKCVSSDYIDFKMKKIL